MCVCVCVLCRYGIDVATSDVVWEFGTGGQIEAAPVVSDGVVYVSRNVSPCLVCLV